MNETLTKNRRYTEINLLTTNARSILNKMQSLHDMFEDLGLGAALVSETWISGAIDNGRSAVKLDKLCQLDIIHKSRKVQNGGGVAIVFDPQKQKFKRFPFKTKFEIVVATAKIERTP